MEGADAELFPHPTRVGVYGASGTGKTQWTLRLLEDKRLKVSRVIWVCPEYSCKQPEIQKLAQQGYVGNVEKSFLLIPAVDGWEDRLEAAIKEGEGDDGKPRHRQIVVLDDLIGSTKSGRSAKVFGELFTGGRHRNLTIIELLQRIFSHGEARLHRLNCPMHVCFALGARDEAGRLFKQVAPDNWRELSAAYEEIVAKNPHGHVMVDQSFHKKYPGLRFRSGDLETCLILAEPEKKSRAAPKKKAAAAAADSE